MLKLCRSDSKGMGHRLSYRSRTYLTIGSVLVQLLIEVIKHGPIMYLFQLHIRINKVVIDTFRLLCTCFVIVFFKLLGVDDICKTKNDSFFILLFLLGQGSPVQMTESSWNAVTIWHVDEVDELFSVVLNVEIEKFDQEAMSCQDTGADSYLRTIALCCFELTFLLDDSDFEQLFDSGGLLKLQVIDDDTFKQVRFAYFRLQTVTFAEVDIIHLHLMVMILLSLLNFMFWKFAGLFHFELGVIIDNFFILLAVNFWFLGQFVGVAQQIVYVLFSELDLLGSLFINELCRVEASDDGLVPQRIIVLYWRVVQHFNVEGAPHLVFTLSKRHFSFGLFLVQKLLGIGLDIFQMFLCQLFSPPPLNDNSFFLFFFKLNFFPCLEKDVHLLFCFDLKVGFIQLILRNKLALEIRSQALFAKSVKYPFSGAKVVYFVEFIADKKILLVLKSKSSLAFGFFGILLAASAQFHCTVQHKPIEPIAF